MEVDIICPLYKGQKYIRDLNRSLLKQEKVEIKSINYILTRTNDQSESVLKELNAKYEVVEPKDFSHSLTREKTAMACEGDILVFITQDVKIERNDWLYELTNPIVCGECEATYSRQLCNNNSIEKYTRERNYPHQSIVKDKKSIDTLGLNTFFFSDASSAIKESIFKELNGYDQKDLPTNEDMYIAYKLIMNGYRIKYCAKSEVIHSHDFTLKETYQRYKLFGQFFRQEPYINEFGTNQVGGGMAIYILKRAIQEKNIKVICKFPFNMVARLVGMKVNK